jgi:nucleoside-diphosphate-sugar epimerase
MFIHALEGKTIRWYGSLDIPIEFIFIEDAGKAMVLVGLSDKSEGKSYNVPGHSITTPREFLNEISRQGWKNSKVKNTRSNLAVGVAGIFSPLAREFKEMMYLKKERFILEGTLFKFTFGSFPSTPYSLGIKKTLRWLRNFDLEKLKKIRK